MNKKEYAKVVLALVVSIYFLAVLLGIYVVIKILNDYPEYSVSALSSLFVFVGTPTSIALGFYYFKAMAENKIKIAKSIIKEGLPENLQNEILSNSNASTTPNF